MINKQFTNDYLSSDFGYPAGRYTFWRGTGTLPIPPGVNKVKLHLWGAGAGGSISTGGTNSQQAPGGCGGGYASAIVQITPGMVLYGSTGDGGEGGISSNSTTGGGQVVAGGNGAATQVRLTNVAGAILFQATGATATTYTGTAPTTLGTPGTGMAGTVTPDWISTGGLGWDTGIPYTLVSTNAGAGGGGGPGSPYTPNGGNGGSRCGGGGNWFHNGGTGDASGTSPEGAGGGAGIGGAGKNGAGLSYLGVNNMNTYSPSSGVLYGAPQGGSGGPAYSGNYSVGTPWKYVPYPDGLGFQNSFGNAQRTVQGAVSSLYNPDLFGITGGGGVGSTFYYNNRSATGSGNKNDYPNGGHGAPGGGGGGCAASGYSPSNAVNASAFAIGGNGGIFGGGGAGYAANTFNQFNQCQVKGGDAGFGAGGGGAVKTVQQGNNNYTQYNYGGAGGPGIILIEW